MSLCQAKERDFLYAKYMGHYDEEMGWVDKFIGRQIGRAHV